MRFLSFLLLFLTVSSGLWAQTSNRAKLEKQRASLLREISATQQQLASTQKDKRTGLGELRALNNKLRTREALISTINKEIGNYNSDIIRLNKEIEEKNKKLNTLRKQYAQSVRYAYKHKTNQNLLVFLFSANSFNDAVRRMQYLKKYRDFRMKQADQIRAAQADLKQKIVRLDLSKSEKAKLLSTEQVQKQKIEEERKTTNEIIKELQGKEGELMASIQKNRATANKIQAAIKAEIQKEIEIARKKAAEEARRKAAEEARKKAEAERRRQAEIARQKEEERSRQEAEALAQRKADEAAKKGAGATDNTYQSGSQSISLNTGSNSNRRPTPKPENTTPEKPKEEATTTSPAKTTSSYRLSLTPEIKALSENFASNHGRLPWPVASGYISDRYGQHPHPAYPSVMIENNGIDITTSPNAPVRAVFEGTVIKVTHIEGYVVMISHGAYFTVYTNLASVSVATGQKVGTKQTIGTAGLNSEGEPVINFQIWSVGANNASSTVNPAGWIAK